MKKLIVLICIACATYAANAQTTAAAPVTTVNEVKTVEAACGECKFGMKGEGCQLAVRIDGKPYFVDGTSIDKHGDAHGAQGFCNAIRKAEVKGSIVNGRFVAANFTLLPVAEAKK